MAEYDNILRAPVLSPKVTDTRAATAVATAVPASVTHPKVGGPSNDPSSGALVLKGFDVSWEVGPTRPDLELNGYQYRFVGGYKHLFKFGTVHVQATIEFDPGAIKAPLTVGIIQNVLLHRVQFSFGTKTERWAFERPTLDALKEVYRPWYGPSPSTQTISKDSTSPASVASIDEPSATYHHYRAGVPDGPELQYLKHELHLGVWIVVIPAGTVPEKNASVDVLAGKRVCLGHEIRVTESISAKKAAARQQGREMPTTTVEPAVEIPVASTTWETISTRPVLSGVLANDVINREIPQDIFVPLSKEFPVR